MLRFNGRIDTAFADRFITALDSGEREFTLSSPGGAVVEAMRIADAITQAGKVRIVATGEVSSAALLILASAEKAESFAGATFMAHQAQIQVNGDSGDLEQAKQAAEAADKAIRDYLATRLNSAGLTAMFADRAHYFGANEAKEYGLVGEVINEDDLLANAESANANANGTGITQTRYTPKRLTRAEGIADGILEANGYKVESKGLNPYKGTRLSDIGNIASGTGDFPAIASDVAERAIGLSFNEQMEQLRYLNRATVKDFRPHTLAALSGVATLPRVLEGGEIKRVSAGEAKFTVQAETYAGIFALTRQAVINDDTGAFGRMALDLAKSAMRAVGDQAIKVLRGEDDYKSYDGEDLYAAAHNNTGDSPPSSSSFDAANAAMEEQLDVNGVNDPRSVAYILVPPSMKGKARSIVSSQYMVAPTLPDSEATAANTALGLVKTEDVISNYRIPAPEYYFLAEDAMLLYTLEGYSAPSVITQMEFDRDEFAWRVIFDFVVALPNFAAVFRGDAA